MPPVVPWSIGWTGSGDINSKTTLRPQRGFWSVKSPAEFAACGPQALRGFLISYVEAEIDHVAVLDHILLALGPQQPLLLGGGHAAAGDHLVKVDGLCPDEAPLDVGVDLSGGLGSLGALLMVQARHSSLP